MELPLVQARVHRLGVGSLLNPLSCWAKEREWLFMSAGVHCVCVGWVVVVWDGRWAIGGLSE